MATAGARAAAPFLGQVVPFPGRQVEAPKLLVRKKKRRQGITVGKTRKQQNQSCCLNRLLLRLLVPKSLMSFCVRGGDSVFLQTKTCLVMVKTLLIGRRDLPPKDVHDILVNHGLVGTTGGGAVQ